MTNIYAGNTTPGEAAAWLKGARTVAVATHFKADGDAVGSSLALARALRRRDPTVQVEVWYAGVLPDYLPAIIRDTPWRHLDSSPPNAQDTPEAIVVTDTGAWTQLGPLDAFLRGKAGQTLIIDHHLSGDPEMADRRIIDAGAASAAQLVAGVACELLGCPAASLPEPVATPLYLGTATDTGWFRYSNVTPAVFRLAADLIQAGVPHTELFRVVEQRDKPGRVRLYGRALASLELLDKDRVALMNLTEADFKAAGAQPGDTGGFADRLLAIESVLVAVVFNESRDHEGRPVTKLSLRSKPGPNAVDVNVVSGALGGGGHARAAGARHTGSLTEARAALLGALGLSASA